MIKKASFNPFRTVREKVAYHREKWMSFFHMASCFFPHVKKQSKRLWLSLFAGVGYTFAGLFEPWPLKMIFDNVFDSKALPKVLSPFIGQYQENKLVLLNILISLIVVVAIVRGIFYYYQQLLTSRSGQQIVTSIRLDLYSHLQHLSFSFHDRRRTGDMLARLTTDIRILRDILISLPLSISGELLLMVSMAIVMAFMDLELTLISLSVIPVLMVLIKKYRFPMKEAMRKQREREGHLTSIASEVLGAIKVVQGFHQEMSEVDKFNVQNKGSLKSGLKATRLEAKLRWASELSVSIVIAIVLGVAGKRVLMGVLSPGDVIVFSYYLRTFNRPLRRISKMTEQMARGTASGERILDLLQIKSDVQDKQEAKRAPRLRGDIQFENVYFEYKSGKPILKNINFSIKEAERVALVGKTGSGKSTIASLLPRFYDASSGVIKIDGIDIREWTLGTLREQISIVFQEPVLFAATIAENIAYGKPGASLEEIIAASKKAHIHDIIESFQEGYDTVIGERGGTLSGGQRQCVAIARSIIKDTPIVILDEPTSGLDMPSALLVMKALKELMVNKTVVLISHQSETLQDVDRVIQINHGVIVQEKKPEDFWIKETLTEKTKK